MPITITDRPSETIDNGFLSKWSSSELPLQYSLDSDLFPINKVDSADTITNLVYDPSVLGVVITFSAAHSYQTLETITVNSTTTSLDGGNFTIKNITSTTVTLDFYTTESSNTGTAIKYYNNYKGLVKVFAGAPDQHPYNLDGSKPLREIGIIEVDFKSDGVDNLGLANVNAYVKDDITPQFDTVENTHYGWGSFSIQFAESYDVSNGNEVTTFQSAFEDDIQVDCEPFVGFVDPSFNNGLDDWLQESSPTGTDLWVTGVGSITSSSTLGTNVVYQNVKFYSGVTYDFDINLDLTITNAPSGINVLVFGKNTGSWDFLHTSAPLTTDGNHVLSIDITPSIDYDNIGIAFRTNGLGIDYDVQLNSLQASTNVAQPCLFVQWANFGAKQFQNNLGGNFGDYVLNVVDSTITPKILTHFTEKTYFKGKPLYVSAIIPESTFSLSESSDSLYVSVDLFNGIEAVNSDNFQITNTGEGVYTVDISSVIPDNCTWVSGTVEFIIVPSNIFIDAINGTFEDTTIANWNLTVLPYSGGTPNQVGSAFLSDNRPRTGALSGDIGWSAPSMNETNKLYSIFENDSEFNIVEGSTYEISSYLVITEVDFEPSQKDNAAFFWLPDGYSKEECTVVEWLLIDDNIVLGSDTVTPETYKQTVTTFVAKTTTTIKLKFYNELTTDINIGTGGNILMDDITLKGPIQSISESLPIKNECDCTLYGGSLRWLNDLNGWEHWYFPRYKQEKERVTKKIDILRDYTTNWETDFIDGDTTKDTIKIFSNKSVLLKSQLLTKNELRQLEGIKRSIRVQMLMDSGKWQTVTIRPSTFTVEDEEQDIQEMTIEVNLPDTVIQKQ